MGVPIVLEGLGKRFDLGKKEIRAVDQVSVSIASGDTVAITGRSGSGKSTLLHLIGAIDVPDSGSIAVGNTMVTDLSRRALATYRSRIGFVFQAFHLLGMLSVVENVEAPLMGRLRGRARRAQAMDLLDAVGLADRAHSTPTELSGGQQQRVAIARALVVEPELLLADEPTGNLDSQTSGEILELLAAQQRARSMTMLIATHDDEVAQFCTVHFRMQDGRLSADLHGAGVDPAEIAAG